MNLRKNKWGFLALTSCLLGLAWGSFAQEKQIRDTVSSKSQLNLTAQAKPSENLIRLDWTSIANSSYKVYQRKEGASEFQSIGTTDFKSTKQVRVLNIFPPIANKVIRFNTWDGESMSLPESGILKQWMEEPNAEHPKGYGKGLIEVTPIEIDMFNLSPDYYLKDMQGNYAYDVIVFGIADSWGGNQPGLTAQGEAAIDEFLSTGRGVLFGHDTAYRMRSGTLSRVDSFSRLAEKHLDLNLYNIPSDELILDNFYNGNDPSLNTSYAGQSTVEITRKGLLTNYPWLIGDVGTQLTTPYTHTAYQKTGSGDIWMRFNWDNRGMDNPFNSYLYTYNNAALIQTGHSIAAASNAPTIATADEKKVLANTLFYLNQLSSDNYLNDYSGQDVAAPTKPSIKEMVVYEEDNVYEMTFNSFVDQGSTYEYYVETQPKNDCEIIL